jgi:RNA-binding protein
MNNEVGGGLGLASATISVVLHATEDIEKVKSSIIKVLCLNSNKFEESDTRGHWGNEISFINLNLEHTEAGHLIKRIYAMLDKNSKSRLLDSLEESVDDKNNLHLRIDKQSLCSGKMALSDQDSIKIKFKPLKTFKPSNNSNIYRDLLLSEQ